MSVRAHLGGDCSKDLVLPGNFPFGSAASLLFRSPTEVRTLLERHRHVAAAYVDNYLRLLHDTQLFNESKFIADTIQFWQNPERFDLGWLAQYLAVMGLGACIAGTEDKVTVDLFFASEACLAQTPFMFRPTVTNIRTLLLHIQAKQVFLTSCWALDASWSMVGLIVRLSVMMGLHRSWIPDPDEIPSIFEEREQRKQLWNAVVKTDIQTSLITGQATPLHLDAFLANAIDSIECLPGDISDILPASFPLICDILTRLNTSLDMISYEEVLRYDTELRKIMQLAVASTSGQGHVLRITTYVFGKRKTESCFARRHTNALIMHS